jgi:hypothetical protein
MIAGKKCSMTLPKVFVGLMFVASVVLGSGTMARAQVSASLSGTVTDTSGASIPEAKVTVKSVETGLTREILSDASGHYRVASLPVGQFEITVEKEGFKRVVRTDITLVVAQEAVVSLQLQVGEVRQEVTVTGEAPLVNTTTSQTSGLVEERQVKELPLNGRSFDNLITLNPGTINSTPLKANGGLAGAGNYFVISGHRPQENTFLLNGIEYTGSSIVSVTPGGVSGQLLGIDGIREFNVVKDAYGAEFGKRGGGQISVVTASGTNGFHGTAFEFLRNSALDARNFYDYSTAANPRRIPAFERNQFGGSGGGPLRKDKMFVFGNYEGFRQRLGLSDVTIVPDLNARKGLLPSGPGGALVDVGLNPAVAPLFNFWPLPSPNAPPLGGGSAFAYSSPPQTLREDFGTARVDRNFSSKDTASAVYTVDDGFSNTPTANPLSVTVSTLRSQVLSLQETHVFSPTVLNTFRAGYSRARFFWDQPPTVPISPAQAPIAGRPMAKLTIGGGSGNQATTITLAGSGEQVNNTAARNLFTYGDDVQISRGRHQISLGGWLQRVQNNNNLSATGNGSLIFSTLQDFIQGNVAQFRGTPNQAETGWRQYLAAWYVQDAIRMRSNVTVTLGLRHEIVGTSNEVAGRQANFVYGPNETILTDQRIGNPVYLENRAKRLFQPRAGVAWDVFGRGKTVVHAGFGFYNDLLDQVAGGGLDPYNAENDLFNVPVSSIHFVPGGGIPPGSVRAPTGRMKQMIAPTIVSYHFKVEQEITRNTVLTLGFAGSHSYHLSVNLDPNTRIPVICSAAARNCSASPVPLADGTVYYAPGLPRRNPNLSNGNADLPAGGASYNGLEVDLNHRLSHGVQLRANYTFAKNLDTATNGTTSLAANGPQQALYPSNLRLDWGLAHLDIRNRANLTGAYELPFGNGKAFLSGATGVWNKLVSGWTFDAILNLQNGFPFTNVVGNNRSADGNARAADRPSLISGRKIGSITSGATTGCLGVPAGQKLGTPDRYFDPCAFSLPPAGTYGTLGKDVLIGPGLAAVDMGFLKNTRITEKLNLQFRAEIFNLLNRANFNFPSFVVFSGTAGAYSPAAGKITATSTTSRQIQFAMKLNW